jgi:hypothetical protein
MSDVIPPSGRVLSGTERQAFERLGLSPGNWAALIAAPLFDRPGLRPPNFQQRSDCLHLESLRRELRTASGLSEQTGQFWRRLGTELGAAEIDLATRLFSWHLATDLPFAKRERVLGLLGSVVGEFTTGTHARAPLALVEDVRLLVDYFLPCQSFPSDQSPRWIHVPLPSAEGLDAIARTISTPDCAWPAIAPTQVAEQLPVLVRLLGAPAANWWGQPHPGRRAVERGMAVLSFAERERLYTELTEEWEHAHQLTPAAGAPVPIGGTFAEGIREWVDAVRKSVRQTESPPEARPPVPVKVLSVTTPPQVRAPVASSWRCAACGAENTPAQRECRKCHKPQLTTAVELRSATTGKVLRVEDGMRVGRAEYRSVFEDPDAGLAAADQFELVRDAAKGVWLVRPLGEVRHPTGYQGTEVGATGSELTADGVITVGGKLALVVRFV